MSFNDVLVVGGFIVTLLIVRQVIRSISFSWIIGGMKTTESPRTVYMQEWWYLLYSSDTFDVQSNYNWIKIKADERKGVPIELAILREEVVALQMLQWDYENINKVRIVELAEDSGEVYIRDLDEYTSYKEQLLIEMEEAFIYLQDTNALIESLDSLGFWEEDDNDEL